VKTDVPLKDKLKAVIKELFEEAKAVKNQLGLETNELLSTLIIGIVDTKALQAEFLAIGDGLISADEEIIHFEQNDKPDYLGYHLQNSFEAWFANQDQKISVSKFSDLSIATDGIYTFKNFTNQNQQLTEKEIIQFLLRDRSDSNYPNFLALKVRQLQEEMNHVVTDDLAIIRIFL
jgi:hypothetical protein